MREGGRSLAAIINVILLVLLVLLWIGFGFLVLGAVRLAAGLEFGAEMIRGAEALEVGNRGRLFALLGFAGIVLLISIALIRKLRDVMRSVERGEPFHPDNPARLRGVAILLAVISVVGMIGDLLLPVTGRLGTGDFDLDLSTWLAVLIIFVLAEIFREGARLRSDADLTV